MRAKIVFHDNSWIIGRRLTYWDILRTGIRETTGTHHWWVEETSWGDSVMVKHRRVAIPISSMKYMVFL